MMRILTIAFQSFILLASVAGVVINALCYSGWEVAKQFTYYTILSNILVAVAMLLSLIDLFKNIDVSRGLRLFKGGVTLWILVTGIVFHFMLSATWHPDGWLGIANILLHYVVPVSMLLDWLIFEEKGHYKYIYALSWLSFPLSYFGVFAVSGAFTGYYPYWFINPGKPMPDGIGSYPGMFAVVGILTAFFAIIGLIIIFVDNRLAGIEKKKA